MWWLLAALAFAEPSVALGDDLADWRELVRQDLDGTAAIAAWRDWLRSYPDSRLAENAVARLQALEGFEGEWAEPELRARLATLAVELERHRADAAAPVLAVGVATLPADGTPRPTAPPPWRPLLETGAGWDGRSVFGTVGLGLERGWAAGLVRFAVTDAFAAQLAGRAAWPGSWGPFVEIGIDTLPRATAATGLRLHVGDRLWAEGSGLLIRDAGAWMPGVRATLTWRPTPAQTAR